MQYFFENIEKVVETATEIEKKSISLLINHEIFET